MASIATVGTILPLASITSCGKKYTEVEAITPKEQNGNNSFKTYTVKLAEKPKNGKVKVKIVNSSKRQDQMSLVSETKYSKNALLASNKKLLANGLLTATSETEVEVDDNLQATVNVIMDEPPVDTSSSNFELQYEYTNENNETKDEKLSDCKYEYKIDDKYQDLSSKDEQYIPTIQPRETWGSRESFEEEYQADVLDPTNEKADQILAQDMYYTISKHIIESKKMTEGDAGYLDPYSEVGVYLNDIATYPDGGIWLRVNFHVKSKKFIPFATTQSKQVFENVDATFQITLDTGYKVTLEDEYPDANGASKVSVNLVTPSQGTKSHGRFKGSLTYNNNTVNNYNGVINYESTTHAPSKPIDFASIFATSCMAWIFNAITSTGVGMNFYTYYGKNVPALSPLGYINIDGTNYHFNDLKASHLCETAEVEDEPNIVLLDDSEAEHKFPRSEFNSPIVFSERIKSIPASFLNGCSKFNSTIDWSKAKNLTSIDDRFLSNCVVFNQPITLPNTLKIIGMGFMNNCTAFNQPIALPDTLKSIGQYFLGNCINFEQDITIPSSVTLIDWYFLYNMPKMNGKTVTLNCSYDAFFGPALNSFACIADKGFEYQIKIAGVDDEYFNKLKEKCHDMDDGELWPPIPGTDKYLYRKLVKA